MTKMPFCPVCDDNGEAMKKTIKLIDDVVMEKTEGIEELGYFKRLELIKYIIIEYEEHIEQQNDTEL